MRYTRGILFFLLIISVFNQNFSLFAQTANPRKNKIQHLSKAIQPAATPIDLSIFREPPKNLRIPGEWEEVQAVLISWPYINYDTTMTSYERATQMSELFSITWAQLVLSIQEECEVWIRIHSPGDSMAVKSILDKYGVALTRYKFFVQKGSNFWVRDYGPIGFYYGDRDSLGFIDTRYTSRDSNDDNLPQLIAKELGIKTLKTSLIYENGNFDTDGSGRGFFTTRVKNANIEVNKWPVSRTLDTMRKTFRLKDMVALKELNCDGGTGHVDMFFKMLNEETIALTEYPASVKTDDKYAINDNYKKLKTLKSVSGKPYKIYRIPLPTADNGNYDNLDCEQLNADSRSYINGLFVNKTFILPIFSDDYSGNIPADDKVIELYQKILPGYKIVAVDSRILSVIDGGIHCITMQIPAENPIRILLKNFPNDEVSPAPFYPISTEISNRDGIRTATVNWRRKGENGWYSYRLAGKDMKNFNGKIDGEKYFPGDTIEYYIEAESYNGKKISKPFTAPEGTYTFIISQTSLSKSQNPSENFSLRISPQPAQETATFTVSLPETGNLTLTISNISGAEVEKPLNHQYINAGKFSYTVFLDSYPSGTYFCTLANDKKILGVRQFQVQR